MKITTQSGILSAERNVELTSEQESEALARVSETNGEWFVQLDLHGNDMDGPYETEDDAILAAREAMASGEITGTIA